MSGSDARPVVDLAGTSMSALALAIPAVAERTGRDVTVVGGLAVVCRLSRPYRATTDLDTVHRRRDDEPAQLELLLASGASRSGPAGVLVPTAVGQVQVDILEVTDADLARLPEDPTDRLHVLSHAWAAASATLVTIRAVGVPDLAVGVAEPGPLVAMKLQPVMNRGRAKEATDLLDIIRLCLDPVAGPTVLTQLANSEPQLREDAGRHAGRWFDHQAGRSLRVVRAVPEGQGIELDDLHLVGELLHSVLPVGGAEGI
ncbi:hypothetical protein Ais01nite_28950 [Asanoa ishikariensis]|uniref:hypothetical protein n=1 Tax=Asanoa ishikariensis TaxID=137265 RepID=UPI000B892472|nr:hypothetical protein [Asanoa ishikariensis]GIF64860.1 hypothetical protein Ais01nite_28950 [Asanoa ishikariensis]